MDEQELARCRRGPLEIVAPVGVAVGHVRMDALEHRQCAVHRAVHAPAPVAPAVEASVTHHLGHEEVDDGLEARLGNAEPRGDVQHHPVHAHVAPSIGMHGDAAVDAAVLDEDALQGLVDDADPPRQLEPPQVEQRVVGRGPLGLVVRAPPVAVRPAGGEEAGTPALGCDPGAEVGTRAVEEVAPSLVLHADVPVEEPGDVRIVVDHATSMHRSVHGRYGPIMWVLLLAALAQAQATVSLLSPGDEPREPLRLAWTDGAQHYTEVTRNHVEVKLGGLLTDPDPVDATQRLAWIARSRQHTLDVELIGASLYSTSDQPGPDLGKLVGLTGTLTVTDLGRTVHHAVTAPPTAALTEEERNRMDALGHRVQQVALPLPAEPVGIGATWRIDDTLVTGPMRLDVVTTATLVEREGPRVTVRLSSAIARAPDEVAIELDGFTGKVKELDVRGSQEVTLRLDRPVAIDRTSRIWTHVVVRGWRGPFPVTVTMDVTQRIRARAKEH